MFSFKKIAAALFVSPILFLGSQAFADHKPDYCNVNHDHRSHASNYYEYYPADSYSRAGVYQASYDRNDRSRYDNNRYDNDNYERGRYDNNRRGRYDRDRRARNNHHRRGRYTQYRRGFPRSQVVFRNVYPTRFRAEVVVVEEIYWTRSGRQQLVCSVVAKGPESYAVPDGRMRSLARQDCSRRARIQYLDY